MAAKMKMVKRYDCTVDPCPRKKPKYFIRHTESGVTLSREDLTRAQALFGDAASVNLNNNVMCDAHLVRLRALRGSALPFEDEATGAGTQNGSYEGSKRRKEQTCTKCGLPKKGHVCASETVPGRSAWAPAVAPVLSSKESRSLIQHLKPTLGKRKGEHPYPFTKHTAARSLFHIATDEQLKRGVRHDASILTRLFTRTVPFRQAGPYEVPPGPFVPNPALPLPPPPAPSGIAALVAVAQRSRSQFAEQPEQQHFERYPIENDLRDMYRRHHAEIGEDTIDQ